MSDVFPEVFKRISGKAAKSYNAKIHGDFINDAGELEFDVEFDGVRDAVCWAEVMRDTCGIHAQLRDPIGSLWQTVVLTATITPETAQRLAKSGEK